MILGEGSVVLCHEGGWACSKEAIFDVEFDIMPDKSAKRTSIVGCKGLFNAVGEVSKGALIEGVFKYDQTNAKIAFTARLEGSGRLVLIGETNNDFETILNKISQWQEQFKAN